jgi:hypothetical protein
MFFVDLKPASSNKDIFQIEYLQQCKITFEPPKQKRDIAQRAKSQRYRRTQNYWHYTPRCVKCAGTHLTSQCSSNVCCVLCGGNHPANYKGCMVYKDLQKKTYLPLRPKIYTPTQTLHTQHMLKSLVATPNPLPHKPRQNPYLNNPTSTNIPTNATVQYREQCSTYSQQSWANWNNG